MSASDFDFDLSKLSVWDNEQFGYSSEYQTCILAALLQSKNLLNSVGIYLKPGYFDNIHAGRVFKGLMSFMQEHKDYPTELVLDESIAAGNNGVISEATKELVHEVYQYQKLSKANIEFIGKALKEFIKNQEAKRVIVSNMDTVSDPDGIDKFMRELDTVRAIVADASDLGIDVYSDESIEERIQQRKNTEDSPRIPFLWTNMDKIFGGLGKKEIFSIIGASGGGKSMFLINIGINVLKQGKNVLHISLELSEDKVIQRYDMSTLKCTKDELKSEQGILELRKKPEMIKGKLVVKAYPSDVTKPEEISKLIRKLESVKGFVPDVLIVDYADILASPVKFQEKRHELGTIYRYLRNIGFEFDIPVVTATQANRGAVEKMQQGKIIDESDIAESYDIFRVLDGAVTINATIDDSIRSKAILYVAKNRDGAIGQKIEFENDWSRANTMEIRLVEK